MKWPLLLYDSMMFCISMAKRFNETGTPHAARFGAKVPILKTGHGAMTRAGFVSQEIRGAEIGWFGDLFG